VKFILALSFAAVSCAFAQSPCTFTFDPPAFPDVPRAGGRVQAIKLTASSPDCVYQLRAPDWINLDYNQGGTGSSEFGITIRQNPSILPRIGVITAGNNRLPVAQRGCSYAVSPTGVAVASAGASGTFRVSGDCGFEAISRSPWLSITQASGSSWTYTVGASPIGIPRTGEVWIGPPGNVDIYHESLPNPPAFRVRQGDILLPGAAIVDARGGTLNISVNVQPGVAWTAVSQEPWVRVLAGAAGIGQGFVSLSVSPLVGAEARTGNVYIAGLTFTITQQPSACKFTVTPERRTFPAAGGSGEFDIASDCGWTASAAYSWVSIATASGEGNGRVRFSLAPNPSATPRTAVINIGAAVFTIEQEANPCNFTLSASGNQFDATGGSGSFTVSGGAGCSWTAATAEDWIEVRTVSGGQVNYIVLPNYSAEPRSGRVAIAGAAFNVAQAGRGPQISSAGVVNAGSFLSGAVAPGEIVTFFGRGIGPADVASLQLTPDGRVATLLAGVRVLFDDVPAPLVYVSSEQVSAIVPYSVAGKTSATVRLEYQGAPSNTLTAPIAAAAPSLFTIDSSGAGQGAIVNQDGSINSSGNPASPGSFVILYATGEGQTSPEGVDGAVTGADLVRPLLPVAVRIGETDAEVLYAGSAPGFVAGVLQVNARVPASLPPGQARVELRVGDVSSQPDVTLAIGP
jgi:uncharacterized protein (TIGR03437 family)